MSAEWEPVAGVSRSKIHHTTWVGVVWDSTFSAQDNPAGPLRLVKAAVVDLAIDDPDLVRWRWRRAGDGWVLTTAPVAAGEQAPREGA